MHIHSHVGTYLCTGCSHIRIYLVHLADSICTHM